MNALWSYFWPAFAAGLVVGALAGTVVFRRRPLRAVALTAGLVISLGLAALWHGPLGGADRFSTRIERGIRGALVYYEMTQVTAHLHRDPLTRRVLLAGPADDFQRSELVRLIDQIPGVREARWSSGGGGLPLIAEGGSVALLGFLLGLLLAYLIELRRRYNAQWTW
jgi:hypothetical protein